MSPWFFRAYGVRVRALAMPPDYQRIYGEKETLLGYQIELRALLREERAPRAFMEACALVEPEGSPPYLFCPKPKGLASLGFRRERETVLKAEQSYLCPHCLVAIQPGNGWAKCPRCGRKLSL